MGGQNFDWTGIGQGLQQAGQQTSQAVLFKRQQAEQKKREEEEKAERKRLEAEHKDRQAKIDRWQAAQEMVRLLPKNLKETDQSVQDALAELEAAGKNLHGGQFRVPRRMAGAKPAEPETPAIGEASARTGGAPLTVDPRTGQPLPTQPGKPAVAGTEILTSAPTAEAEVEQGQLVTLMQKDLDERRAMVDKMFSMPGADRRVIWAAAKMYNDRVAQYRQRAIQADPSITPEQAELMFPSIEQSQLELGMRGLTAQEQDAKVKMYVARANAFAKMVARHQVNYTVEGGVALQRAMEDYNKVWEAVAAAGIDPATVGLEETYKIPAEMAKWQKGQQVTPKQQVEEVVAQTRLAAHARWRAGDRSPETLAILQSMGLKVSPEGFLTWKGISLNEQWKIKAMCGRDIEFQRANPWACKLEGPEAGDKVWDREMKRDELRLRTRIKTAEARLADITKVWDSLDEKTKTAARAGTGTWRENELYDKWNEATLKVNEARAEYEEFQNLRAAESGAKPQTISWTGPMIVEGFNVFSLWDDIRAGRQKMNPREWASLPAPLRAALEKNGVVNGQYRPKGGASLDPRLGDLVQSGTFAGVSYRVTSTTGGKHVRGSKHYAGRAIDIVPNLPRAAWDGFIRALRAAGFRVLDERTRVSKDWTGPHLHVEI